jgi:hypothetical protein
MPKIETWDNLPAPVRDHLIERMRERSISIADLNQLRVWIESRPEVPDGDWYKDFGSFKDLRPRLISKDLPAPGTSGEGNVGLTRTHGNEPLRKLNWLPFRIGKYPVTSMYFGGHRRARNDPSSQNHRIDRVEGRGTAERIVAQQE